MKKKWIRSFLFIGLILAIAAAVYMRWNYKEPDKTESIESKNEKIIIAIDPGHGGPNLDQRGYSTLDGTPESVINNALSLKLEKILIERGYEVIFTKEPKEEVYLDLQERPAAANKAKADLLISIHHDANPDEELKGFWLFYSSYKVNLDNNDLVVIYKEKEYSLVSEKNLLDKDNGAYTVKTITDGTTTLEINSQVDIYKVIDKTPCDIAVKSKELANIVYDKLLKLDYIEPKGKIADTIIDEEYRVLRYADMPSVLIEAGFMTHPTQMLDIQKSENQQAFALALADAIDQFFDK